MKNLFLALFLCFLIVKANAQNFEAKLIGGFTASQIDGDADGGFNKLGLLAGTATNFYFSEKISLQEEVVFYMRGARERMGFYNVRMNYLDINVLLNIYFSEKIFLQTGPTYGVLLSAKQNGWDIPDALPYSLCGNLGVGYMLTEKLEVNARALYSMVQVNRKSAWMHNSLSASLRVHF